ncbi:MAG: hypothetical protein PSY14_03105 [bacterium]|nr:hypothetical protein [bacterium]
MITFFRIVIIIGVLIAIGIGVSAVLGTFLFGIDKYLIGILTLGFPVTLTVIAIALIFYGFKISTKRSTSDQSAEFLLARKLSEHQTRKENNVDKPKDSQS